MCGYPGSADNFLADFSTALNEVDTCVGVGDLTALEVVVFSCYVFAVNCHVVNATAFTGNITFEDR